MSVSSLPKATAPNPLRGSNPRPLSQVNTILTNRAIVSVRRFIISMFLKRAFINIILRYLRLVHIKKCYSYHIFVIHDILSNYRLMMRDILRNIFWRGDISPLKKIFLNISRIKKCIITLLYRTSLKGIWIKNWNWVASTFIPKPYILQTNKMPVIRPFQV